MSFLTFCAQIDNFVERRIEMYEIASLLYANRLVTIRGPPGIGKTSIATQLCHYLLNRGHFEAGVVFVALR